MRHEGWLRKSKQYSLVYRKGRSWANSQLAMKILPNDLNLTRFGISTSRRVGKAVVRNRIKRLLREILRSQQVKEGWDIVIIARPQASNTTYERLGKSAEDLIARAGLFKSFYKEATEKINGDADRS